MEQADDKISRCIKHWEDNKFIAIPKRKKRWISLISEEPDELLDKENIATTLPSISKAMKKKQLSLQHGKKKVLSPNSRFPELVKNEDVTTMSKSYVPPNTQNAQNGLLISMNFGMNKEI